ncbi:MAG: CDP-diacylglycerol--glycerol-3-phosphate 3-phosphatidyltransferase [Deltaproteobacteria bacterium]|nr:MAG: CDP-diacylglycerol--glycerol-3-phosphate 3-phosphatidyltransferase [Deltaproteobacteria bacterium]
MGTDAAKTPRTPRSLREELTNLPNLLTMSRIALIPPVMLLMLLDTPVGNFFATLLFAIAAITDWLDGYLARKRGLVSVLGKFLDPLADKLIVLATLILAAELHRIPGWFVVLLLSREITITGLRAIASSEGLSVDVVRSGKFKTAFQLVGIVALMLDGRYLIDFGFSSAIIDFNALGVMLLALSMVFSLLSAVQYFVGFLRSLAARNRTGEPPTQA